jgi:hypothetical protein
MKLFQIKCSDQQKEIIKEGLAIMSEINNELKLTKYVGGIPKNNINQSIVLIFEEIESSFRIDKNMEDENHTQNVPAENKYKNLSAILNKIENNKMKFSIDELETISLSSQNLARIAMGQFDLLVNILDVDFMKFGKNTRKFIKDNLDLAEKSFQLEGDNKSFMEKDVKYAASWDIYKVVRNIIAYDRKPEGDIFVDFDKPMKTSELEIIKVEQIKNKPTFKRK